MFFSFQITVRIITLSPLGKNKLEKQRKQQQGGQAAIYQFHRVSACLRLISPSHSSLCPPCYEAIMWIFMKSDLYQQKTSALHTLSPALLLYQFSVATLHLVLLHPSLFLPLICVSHITSLPLTLFLHLHLKYTFLMALIRPFFHTQLALWGVCVWMIYYTSKVMSRDQSPQFCKNTANRMLEHHGFMENDDLLPEIEPFSSKGPQRLGYGSNNESKASLANTQTHTQTHIFTFWILCLFG